MSLGNNAILSYLTLTLTALFCCLARQLDETENTLNKK